MKLLRDILTTTSADGKKTFGQGRVYLFVSFISFIIITFVVFGFAFKNDASVNEKKIDLVLDNLKWALGTFALYVLGDKGVSMIRQPYPRKRNEDYLPPEDEEVE